MGWANGSQMAKEIWEIVRPLTIPGTERKSIAAKIIEIFENEDCDTMDEAEILVADAK